MTGASTRRPTFRDLWDGESEELLARNHTGRLAYSFKDRVGITPLHYVFSDGWIYGRTGSEEPWRTIRSDESESKLSTILHNRWVAFEVDEVDGIFDWISVVVRGAFYILSPDHPQDREPREKAIELIRNLIPDTLTEDDPTPFRDLFFRIQVQELTGREARTNPQAETPADAEKS